MMLREPGKKLVRTNSSVFPYVQLMDVTRTESEPSENSNASHRIYHKVFKADDFL